MADPEIVKTDFLKAVEEAGIRRLIFVRHAKAEPPRADKKKTEYDTPHDWKRDDQMRPLVKPAGREQAEAARRWFLDGVKLENFKCLVASGARRAAETLEIMASSRNEEGKGSASASASIRLMGSLHPAGISKRCEELFDQLNYGPLDKFFKEDGGLEAFEHYSDIVVREFVGVLESLGGPTSADAIALFGHAVFHNAVAWRIACYWGASEQVLADLTALDLGESEGLWITKEADGRVSVKHLHCRMLGPEGLTSHPLFA